MAALFSGISETKAISLMQNIDLNEKAEHYEARKFITTYKNR